MAEDATVVATKPPAPKRLQPARCQLAEHVRQVWVAVSELSVEPKDLLEPAYWTHVSAKFRIGDLIEVMPDDGQWYAKFIVRNVGTNWAEVAMLDHYRLGGVETKADAISDKFKVEWKGPHWKHTVIRLSDNQPMQTGFDTRDAGQRWLLENAKTLMGRTKAA